MILATNNIVTPYHNIRNHNISHINIDNSNHHISHGNIDNSSHHISHSNIDNRGTIKIRKNYLTTTTTTLTTTKTLKRVTIKHILNKFDS